MPSSAHDHAVENIIESLDRTQFLAQNVRIGDNSSFQQTRNVTVNLPSPRTASPPEGIYDVPDNLSPYFLGRDDELRQIRSALQDIDGDFPARCIVYGMPGMGKTQIALKYASTANQEEWYDYIFWISATSPDKFNQGYSSILHQIAHPIRHESDREVQCKAVKAWLEAQEKGWLVILDNIQKETLVVMRDFMPQRNPHGHILCTTRTVDLAEGAAKAHGQQFECLELSKLPIEDAIRLLTSKLDTSPEELETSSMEAATEVVTSAGCLPLVIFQAASFIQFSRMSLGQASRTYRTKGAKALDWKSSDSLYEGSLASVYSASLKGLQEKSPVTVDLLRLLLFFDPEGIPIKLLRSGGDRPIEPAARDEALALRSLSEWPSSGTIKMRLRQHHALASAYRITSKLERKGTPSQVQAAIRLQDLLKNQVKFSQALQDLQELSIISQSVRFPENTIWMHDLVHEILFAELMQDMSQQQFWLARTVQLVFKSHMEDDENLQFSNRDLLTAQVTCLKKSLDTCDMESMMFNFTCFNFSTYHYNKGHYEQSGTLIGWCFSSLKKILGSNHSATLDSMHSLGRCLTGQMRYNEAEQLLTRASKLAKSTQGVQSEIYLWSIIGLGEVYRDQCRHRDSADIITRSLEDNKLFSQRLKSRTLLACCTSLSEAYLVQLRYKDAEALLSKALRHFQGTLGRSHMNTIECKVYLSDCFIQQKKYKKGEAELLEARRICEVAMMSETQVFRHILLRLSRTYFLLDRFDEARALQERLLEEYIAHFGLYHITVLDTMHCLQSTLAARQNYSAALALQEECVKAYTIIFGHDNERTQDQILDLAMWKDKVEKQASREQEAQVLQQTHSA